MHRPTAESKISSKANDSTAAASNIKKIVYSCQISHSGDTISVIGLKVEGGDRPPLIFAHDIGESTARYEALSENLAEAGYSVYSFDMREHGKNSIEMTPADGVLTLVKDLLQVIALIRHKEEGRKPVVIARGMGALLTLTVTRAHAKFARGVIFASPMFNMNNTLTPMQRFLIRSLAELAPNSRLPQWITPKFTYINQDSYLSKGTQSHPRMNSSFALELLNSVAQSRKLIKRLNIPALFICPEEDPDLRYEFLKNFIQKHLHEREIDLRYVKYDDNLALERGSQTLQNLSIAIIKWLEELKDEDTFRLPPP